MKKLLRNNAIMFLFILSAIAVLVMSIISNVLINSNFHMLEINVEQRLLTLSQAAARLDTAHRLSNFTTIEDMDTPAYQQAKDDLTAFAKESNVLYVYYMRPVSGKLQFIVDNDFDPETRVDLSSPPVDYEPAAESALNGTPASSGIGNYSINWGGLISAYAPVYDKNGTIHAIAGVDISDQQMVTTFNNTRTLLAIQIVVMLIMLFSGFTTIILYRRKARQSEEANVAKGQFLSQMSHEIRTPLNAIIGLCRMAIQTEDSDKKTQYLGQIDTSSQHLLRLINDVLDLSKIESGKIVLEVIPADLRNEIQSIEGMIRPQANAKNQQFTVALPPDLPPAFYFDTTHLRQILVNLLSNAVKFTPEGGRIFLRVEIKEHQRESYHLTFSVQDDGIGISPGNLSRLFSPFEQEDLSTTRKYGGTGLGLTISAQLAEMMGGNIQVDSTLGMGSTFTLFLPLQAASATALGAAEEAALSGEGAPDLKGKHILLVEDAEINQMIAEDIFTSMGAEVDLADNGLVAFERYTQHPQKYDLIFMDVQMPVMDGYETTRQIRASGAPGAETIPIIAMTANVFKEDVRQALDAGMNAHVGKPFEVEQIEKAIRSVM